MEKPLSIEQEKEFHATAQRNALGGYIRCNGPECWELIRAVSDNNFGHKIQGTR